MNIFNRFLVILGILLIGSGCSAILMITFGMLDPEQMMPSPWHQIFTPLTQLEGTNWWSVVGVCLGLLCLGLCLLIVEFIPHSSKNSAVTVKKDDLGHITASLTSIQDLVNREAGKIEGILESSTKVKEGSDGIHLHCRLIVTPQASANVLGPQVQDRAKEVVERYLGKNVVEIHIQTQMAPLEKNTRRIQSRVR
ncbi:MAG TPA: alkaline shock response membrane anchor protein AmaP [Nitrospirales bacterium]|nr:alkaline shock response membrane anchor protein AmaP [Nitrospirales bacterium]